jgi:pimeloyl-ACP methyl ester carboxylesterase
VTVEDRPRAGRREWVGLAVIALPCLLYAMDLTVLNLAVPHLSADLEPSSAQLLWIVDIYGSMTAGLLIVAHVTFEHTVALYRGLPNAELAVVPGTSHGLLVEKPSLCTTILVEFLTTEPVPTLAPIRRAGSARA